MSTHTVALQNFPLGHNILPYCRFCSSQVTAKLVTFSSLQVLHFTNPHRSCCLKICGDPHETPEACGVSGFTATFDSVKWHSTTYQLARFVPLLLPLLLWPEWIIASTKKESIKAVDIVLRGIT